jgi:hypothetical protein
MGPGRTLRTPVPMRAVYRDLQHALVLKDLPLGGGDTNNWYGIDISGVLRRKNPAVKGV